MLLEFSLCKLNLSCLIVYDLPLMSAFSNRTQMIFSFSSVGGAPVYACNWNERKESGPNIHISNSQLLKIKVVSKTNESHVAYWAKAALK